jgi:hypothetical protein
VKNVSELLTRTARGPCGEDKIYTMGSAEVEELVAVPEAWGFACVGRFEIVEAEGEPLFIGGVAIDPGVPGCAAAGNIVDGPVCAEVEGAGFEALLCILYCVAWLFWAAKYRSAFRRTA